MIHFLLGQKAYLQGPARIFREGTEVEKTMLADSLGNLVVISSESIYGLVIILFDH